MARKPKDPNAETAGGDDEEASDGVIPVNSLGTYGIKILDRYSVCIMKRAYYEEDTVIEAVGKTFTFYAGQHGPWKKAERPYQPTIRSALKLIFEWMVQDKLQDAGDISFVIEHMDECLKSIEDSVSNLAGLPNLKKLA